MTINNVSTIAIPAVKRNAALLTISIANGIDMINAPIWNKILNNRFIIFLLIFHWDYSEHTSYCIKLCRVLPYYNYGV